MAEPPAADDKRRRTTRRRAREAGGARSHRFLVSFNDDEMTLLREAAARDNTALAAWVADAALAVAKEALVPVSVDAKEVVKELIESRNQLRRVGVNHNQIAKVLNSDGEVVDEQMSSVYRRLETAIRRVDQATLQLMRERQPRS